MSSPEKKKIRWYFDFISPFAYLQFKQLESILLKRNDFELEFVPILFAGLLNHNDNKGPAEIPSKRLMTYRFCHWYAERHNIPFNMPAAHPFNPLPFLRLAIATDCDQNTIAKLFRHIWVDSETNTDFFSLDALRQLPNLEQAADLVSEPWVKSKLKSNTEDAIQGGVFGVPTIAIDGQLFWGVDMTEMAFEFLDHSDRLRSDEYQRIEQLPIAQRR